MDSAIAALTGAAAANKKALRFIAIYCFTIDYNSGVRPTRFALFAILLCQAVAADKNVVLIRAGRLIDVRAGKTLVKQTILIEGDRVKQVGVDLTPPTGAQIIDLSGYTVLPGLIDNHTHILLHGDITAADYDAQLLKESIPYRTIGATVAARTALMNGFTTLRDLETEGAMYADVDVKTAKIGRAHV